jgi:hypothetical protein
MSLKEEFSMRIRRHDGPHDDLLKPVYALVAFVAYLKTLMRLTLSITNLIRYNSHTPDWLVQLSVRTKWAGVNMFNSTQCRNG